MGDSIKVTGMVLFVSSTGDYDKRVVMLTKERGKITAFARGARRQSSTLLAATNPFAFGEFTLYEGRTSYTLVQASISNYFSNLSTDYEGVCYGCYIMEVVDYFTRENADEIGMLKLAYQTLKALAETKLEKKLIRHVFEFKTLVIQGEYPEVFQCQQCGGGIEDGIFSFSRRGMICSECSKEQEKERLMYLHPATIYTLQYIITTPIEKLYTFNLTEQILSEFGKFIEKYMKLQIHTEFKSLDVLKLCSESLKNS